MPVLALCLPITSRDATKDMVRQRVDSLVVPKDAVIVVGTDEGDYVCDEVLDERVREDVVPEKGVGRPRSGEEKLRLLDLYCDLMAKTLKRFADVQYVVMWGDDVAFCDEDTPKKLAEEISDQFPKLPDGTPFGCVVLNDVSSPGFPTYPVVSRTHFKVFKRFCPEVFNNQDADPFIYEVYRRFAFVKWLDNLKIDNTIGGARGKARYEEHHVEWKHQLLDDATEKVETFLKGRGEGNRRVVTIDTVTPTFRGNLELLEKIAMLRGDKDRMMLHHVIVDNPGMDNKTIGALRALEWRYPNVRVRVLPERLVRGTAGSTNLQLTTSYSLMTT
eukprot:TRINITY_DN26211_c0_g1_i1.p1 TRINITY_DN26211_c0_g1~~TRINITY_DN26211_c0_g1_i1.p1  ORF type:complete len:331 (+),score=45.01 TRINITY_DN26211_c0_g1_i1:83-1075(+)